MSLSRKYSRTYHYPFSPGTSSDDRIHPDYWPQVEAMPELVHTEKLDGENTCLNQHGVFARSHAAPTEHPWAKYLVERWRLIRHQLGALEIFGENLYAVHSIRYERLEQHFYVFAVREDDQWLSWEEVCWYAALLDFPVVPELARVKPAGQASFEQEVLALAAEPSLFGSVDAHSGRPCSREGIVSRTVEGFAVDAFADRVFKYVRANHVQTSEHWRRNWKRAGLVGE